MKKMVMAIVPRNEAELVLNALVDAGHTATYSETRGGMLRQSQLTLFIAINPEDLEKVLSIIHDNCRTQVQVDSNIPNDGFLPRTSPVTAELGGAVVFIWNFDRLETY